MVKTKEEGRVLCCHSARASVKLLPGGVVDVTYSGAVGQSALESLHAQVMRATLGAGALVLQLDKSVMCATMPPGVRDYAGNDSPACWIVPEDAREVWLARADGLVARGLRRFVFSRRQAALAYALAADLAAARQ